MKAPLSRSAFQELRAAFEGLEGRDPDQDELQRTDRHQAHSRGMDLKFWLPDLTPTAHRFRHRPVDSAD